MRFEVLEPKDLSEACFLLAQYRDKARILSGGQSLLPLLKHKKLMIDYLIDIKRLSDLEYIVFQDDQIKIGALVTNRAIELSSLIKEKCPMLAKLERFVGDIQTRNWGTLVGNLCAASPTSDLAPVLIALKATMKVRSVRGRREIPLEEFFIDYRKTVLAPDEIVTEIDVPELPPNSGAAYHKERVRMTDSPIASVAAMISLDPNSDMVTSARIVLQAVGPIPFRAKEGEKRIRGEKLEEKILNEVVNLAADEAHPISDVYGSGEYKREMAKVATKLVITEAVRQTKSAALKRGCSK